ncbi:hypothetical protein [Paucilactobacillus hokkaidonensis]|uniref:hypothetical protein n=1 Tax=Paucilactobacillus hokkaidonensis TaxID=1193095 RepID=UPI0020938F2D|nr:hypothetical protein [Paucilactobacillus hokkaidonensis]
MSNCQVRKKTDIRLLKGAKFASLLGGCSAATHQALDITEQQLKFNYSLKMPFQILMIRQFKI